MSSFLKKLSTTTALVGAGIGLTGVALATAIPGADASECVDSDGDGWGWDGSATCDPNVAAAKHNDSGAEATTPDSGDPQNSDAQHSDAQQSDDQHSDAQRANAQHGDAGNGECVDSDGDGWGWNGSSTCEPECVDSDRDGWGWNGSSTCEPECVDSDGDGWGWNGKATCIPNHSGRSTKTQNQQARNTTQQTENQVETSDEASGGQIEELLATAMAAGDNRSAGASSDSGAADNATIKPVVRTASGSSPGCEDYDGDGWGWDGAQTCIVDGAPPVAAAKRGQVTTQDEACGETAWEEIAYDDLIIQHNVWNESSMYDKNFELCTRLANEAGEPVAQWDYDFLDRDDGNEYQVKAYPQVYYGKKVGASESGPVASLGLPAPVNNLDDFDVTYDYSEQGKGERNVALESFFYDDCSITQGEMDYEMMVWVGKPDERTGGSDKIGEANIDGADWDLYVNKNLPWNYLSYVAKQPSTSGTVDWNEFVDYTKNEAPRMGAPRLDSSTCMNGIELGTEIFWGEGEFTLHEFDVSRNGN